MAKPIAGINDYPYGVCGFIANGVHFHNQTTTTNLRIYKQRSDVMFDLIDPSTMKITQKLLLTGVDLLGYPLDYSLTDVQLTNMIPRNTFFMRGYNPSHTIEGFVVRWLLNKKILSNGKVLYDIYTPECGIPPVDISNIVVNPVQEGDDKITGTIIVPGGSVNTSGMTITATLPDGSVVSGTVNSDGSFEIDIPDGIVGTGNITIDVKSPNYNDKQVVVAIIPSGSDSDYTTEIYIPSSSQVQSGTIYTTTIPANVHGRGNDLIVQLQSTSSPREVFFSTVQVQDGNITIKTEGNDPFYVILIGKTLQSTPIVIPIDWVQSNNEYVANITNSQHGKTNISYSIYDNDTISTVNVELDENEGLVLHSLINFIGTIVIAGKI